MEYVMFHNQTIVCQYFHGSVVGLINPWETWREAHLTTYTYSRASDFDNICNSGINYFVLCMSDSNLIQLQSLILDHEKGEIKKKGTIHVSADFPILITSALLI